MPHRQSSNQPVHTPDMSPSRGPQTRERSHLSSSSSQVHESRARFGDNYTGSTYGYGSHGVYNPYDSDSPRNLVDCPSDEEFDVEFSESDFGPRGSPFAQSAARRDGEARGGRGDESRSVDARDSGFRGSSSRQSTSRQSGSRQSTSRPTDSRHPTSRQPESSSRHTSSRHPTSNHDTYASQSSSSRRTATSGRLVDSGERSSSSRVPLSVSSRLSTSGNRDGRSSRHGSGARR